MTIGIGTASLMIWVILAHWFADFVCQTRWQAENKSSNFVALGRHVSVYTMVMTSLMMPALTVQFGHDVVRLIGFLAVTYVAHFATDAITSRLNAFLWRRKRQYAFFVSIGFDQVLHYVQLFLTIAWLGVRQ